MSSAPTVEFAAPPAGDQAGRIATAGGRLCLDLAGGVASDGARVQVYECNRSVAQVWTFTPDGALQVLGRCANVGGDDGVHIVKCDGRTTARWRARADGTLVNAAAGRCLTDPSGGVRSGVAVRVAACGGGGNQRWSLP
ncbi:ricin-type beta-trefoil lectin domain protein [Wangella sp. NEAU-J3]|nr:ricin-type beta-trefoil lectin domain protein [Jidongwangia harbinensis]